MNINLNLPEQIAKFVKSKQSWFVAVAIVLLVIEVFWVSGSFAFLLGKIDQSYSTKPTKGNEFKFDIESFERLNLIQ